MLPDPREQPTMSVEDAGRVYFGFGRAKSYAEAARTWLHAEAEVVDTTHLTAAQAALQIAEAVKS